MINFNEYLEERVLNHKIEIVAALMVETGFTMDSELLLNEFIKDAWQGFMSGFKKRFGTDRAFEQHRKAALNGLKQMQILYRNAGDPRNAKFSELLDDIIQKTMRYEAPSGGPRKETGPRGGEEMYAGVQRPGQETRPSGRQEIMPRQQGRAPAAMPASYNVPLHR